MMSHMCRECAGRGTVRAAYGPVVCPDCDGRGTEPNCDICDSEVGVEMEESTGLWLCRDCRESRETEVGGERNDLHWD